MSTGDIKNNLRKLKAELKKVNYTDELDVQQLNIGISSPLLLALHHLFADYSVDLSKYFLDKGYDFYGKSDLRFLEVVYKILVQEFGLKPMLTKQQFFAVGYAEVKVIFVTKIIQLCYDKNRMILNELGKKNKKKGSFSKLARTAIPNSSEIKLKDNSQSTTTSKYLPDPAEIVEKHFLPPVVPPLPNPELALTPVKENLKNGNRFDHTDSIQEIACSLLDVTELDEDAGTQTSMGEVVDGCSESVLPRFKITKHQNTDVLVSSCGSNLKNSLYLKQHTDSDSINQLSMMNTATTSEPTDFVKYHNANSIYSNSSVMKSLSSAATKNVLMQCNLCQNHSKEIYDLKSKAKIMEKQLTDVIAANNELSARLILMETKVSLLDCSSKLNNDQRVIEQNAKKTLHSTLPVDHFSEVDIDESLNEECVNETLHPDANINVHENIQSVSETGYSMQQEKYSPVKYTDDEIIVKDFKPLRMTDVQKLLDKVDSSNKENLSDNPYIHHNVQRNDKQNESDKPIDKSFVNRVVPIRKKRIALKVNNGQVQESIPNTMISPDITLVDNIALSNSTKKIVDNVKERLKETEQLLRSNANTLIQ